MRAESISRGVAEHAEHADGEENKVLGEHRQVLPHAGGCGFL